MIKRIDWVFVLISAVLVLKLIPLFFNNYVHPEVGMLGIMARHMLDGSFPVFYYGYEYMGSAKCFFAATLFFFFGSSIKVMFFLPGLMAMLFAWTTYWLGSLLGGRVLARIAMLFTVVGSDYYLVHYSSEFVSGYMDTLIYGNLLLIFLYKFTQEVPEKQSRWICAMGLVGGVAFWQFTLITYYLCAVLISVFLIRPKNLFSRHLPYFILLFIIGSFPFWLWNFFHDFNSFKIVQTATLPQFFENCLRFFKDLMWGVLGEPDNIQTVWELIGWHVYCFSYLAPD